MKDVRENRNRYLFLKPRFRVDHLNSVTAPHYFARKTSLNREMERMSRKFHQKVPEPHAHKNRAHIDLDVKNIESAVQRVVDLGGTKLDEISE